jgi:hypothetical protein
LAGNGGKRKTGLFQNRFEFLTSPATDGKKFITGAASRILDPEGF